MTDDRGSATNWTSLYEAEKDTIRRRRKLLREGANCSCWKHEFKYSQDESPIDGEPRVGLALSGGGIRSATFSLGLLRSLSNALLVHRIDYLSTVSGGGYAGAFFCSIFVPRDFRGPFSYANAPAYEAGKEPRDTPGVRLARRLGCNPLGSPRGVRAIAQLRQGGHYLAPNGTSDALFAAVIGIRNWFAVAITMGLALLAGFLFINLALILLEMALAGSGPALTEIGIATVHPWQVVLVVLAFWPASTAWAYWFARSGRVPRLRTLRLVSVQSLVAVLIFLLAYFWPTSREGWHLALKSSIMAMSVLALLTYIVAEAVSTWRDRREGAVEAKRRVDFLSQEDRVRDLLSRWLLTGTVTLISFAILAGIHWASWEDIGRQGKQLLASLSWADIGIAAGIIAIAVPIGRWLLARENGVGTQRRGKAVERRRLRHLAALLVGISFLLAFLLFWATMASGTTKWIRENTDEAWRNLGSASPQVVELIKSQLLNPFGVDPSSLVGVCVLLGLITIAVSLVAYLIGNVDSLLNRSSFSTFYGSRLRAAYLGATNRHRQRATEKSVDQDDVRDEITLAGYYHTDVLAPLHLINVTINETTSKSSRVVQRDRKGKSLTIAPAGYVYPPGAPGGDIAVIPRDKAEDLPLSSWMAISGAAFTTGSGHHTSLGTAMLASLTNLRLGYWW